MTKNEGRPFLSLFCFCFVLVLFFLSGFCLGEVCNERAEIGSGNGAAHIVQRHVLALVGISVRSHTLSVPHVKVSRGVCPSAVGVSHNSRASSKAGRMLGAAGSHLSAGDKRSTKLSRHEALHLCDANQIAFSSPVPNGSANHSGLNTDGAESESGANGARVGQIGGNGMLGEKSRSGLFIGRGIAGPHATKVVAKTIVDGIVGKRRSGGGGVGTATSRSGGTATSRRGGGGAATSRSGRSAAASRCRWSRSGGATRSRLRVGVATRSRLSGSSRRNLAAGPKIVGRDISQRKTKPASSSSRVGDHDALALVHATHRRTANRWVATHINI